MPRRHNRRRPRHKFTEPNKIPLSELYQRDKGICCRCKKPVNFEEATREHITPKSRGGRNGTNFSNVGLAHEDCNKIRGNDPVWEETLI